MKKQAFRMTALLSTTILISAGLSAQNGVRGAGFVFGSAGTTAGEVENRGIYQIGGGGEAVFENGLGFALQLGYLGAFERGFLQEIGVFSPGAIFEFEPDKKTSGYLVGGYSLFFRSEAVNGFHFGGGVRRWFSDRFGMRFGVRDEVIVNAGVSIHFIQGRVSFLFR